MFIPGPLQNNGTFIKPPYFDLTIGRHRPLVGDHSIASIDRQIGSCKWAPTGQKVITGPRLLRLFIIFS